MHAACMLTGLFYQSPSHDQHTVRHLLKHCGLVARVIGTFTTVGDTVLEIGTGKSVSLISKEIGSFFSALQQNQARFLNSLIFLGLNPVSQFLRPDF